MVSKVEQRRARVVDAIVAAATEVMAEGGAAALSLGRAAAPAHRRPRRTT